MNLYHIDDGETWKITGNTKEEALRLAWKIDIDEEHRLSSEDLIEMDDNEVLKVFLPDFHPLDLTSDEYPHIPTKDEKENWFCTATVGEWLKDTEAGVLICSSVY